MSATGNARLNVDRPILGISIAGFLLSLLFAWMVPFGANPDETAHRDHVALLAKEGRLVVFVPPSGRQPLPDTVLDNIEKATGMRELPEGAPSRDEAHQPPFYYAVAARVWNLSNGNVFLLRALSSVFQFATIHTVGMGLLGLFPRRREIAVAAAALVAVWPVQAQLGGAVSNDALCHFWCAIILVALARWVGHGARIKDAVVVGVVFGCGLLTKTTVLQTAPLIVIALGLAATRKKMSWTTAAVCTVVVLGIGITIASPWYLRNIELYNDPLARTIYVATGPNFEPASIQRMAGWTPAEYYRQVGIRTLATVWYFLDPNLPFRFFTGPVGPLAGVLAMVLTGSAGLWRIVSNRSDLDADEKSTLGLLALAPWVLLPFYLVFVSTVFQAQGRYFLPALVGVAATLVFGWGSLFPQRRNLAAFAPVVLLGLLCLIQWTGAGFVPSGPTRAVPAAGG